MTFVALTVYKNLHILHPLAMLLPNLALVTFSVAGVFPALLPRCFSGGEPGQRYGSRPKRRGPVQRRAGTAVRTQNFSKNAKFVGRLR